MTTINYNDTRSISGGTQLPAGTVLAIAAYLKQMQQIENALREFSGHTSCQHG